MKRNADFGRLKLVGIDSRNGHRAFEIRRARYGNRWDLIRVQSQGARETCPTIDFAKKYGSRLLPSVEWRPSDEEQPVEESANDYRPEWDYEVDEAPHAEVKRHVETIMKDHASLHHHLGLHTPTVHYVKNLTGHLARYVSGTSSSPHIVVDSHAIDRSSKKYRVKLRDAVESTLLHEYGHAHFDSTGEHPDDEEKRVENFAHHTWQTGDYRFAKSAFLKAPTTNESAPVRARFRNRVAEVNHERPDLYHVTFTDKVPSIRKKGILPLQTSNWVKGSGERYGNGEIFAFEHPHDAVRWAANMDWEYHHSNGTGKVSVVRFRNTGGWEEDDSDPISHADAKGRWFKRYAHVPASDIVDHAPVTNEHIRAVVRGETPELFPKKKGAA